MTTNGTDLGLLVLRLGAGGAVAAHGAQKLFGWFGGYGPTGTGQYMASLGFPGDGKRNALLGGAAEFGGGVLLALGLATGSAGAAVIGNMAVAASTHRPQGFFNASGGYELPAMFGLVGTALAVAGPGRYSLDQLTGNKLNRPWMTVIALAGSLGSAAYLISGRQVSQPVPDDVDAAESATADVSEPDTLRDPTDA
jgi:putative oxidoreductase